MTFRLGCRLTDRYGDPSGAKSDSVARYEGESVFQRSGRTHEIGAVIAESGAQCPTSEPFPIEWHYPLSVKHQLPGPTQYR